MKKKGGKGKVIDTAEFVTVVEAAEMRGVSRAAIHELIKRGRLRAERLFGKVLLYRSEVEAFERRKPGPKSELNRKAR
ncbi:MAG: Helix-turn-helix domain [Acidobacteriota bacterium]|jgi:excisionase family DNA binding protein|nr:Helix-turn-helix domain [Acidobacteriota bacterium]